MTRHSKPHLPRLTLFGRSVFLLLAELFANSICWILAGIFWGRFERGLLNIALLAWTLGLRHALDADHISAIDNATRNLISLGQLPVTCGLYFSLGHSTVVIVVNVAIVISTDIYNKIDGMGNVGSIIGSAVSGSFLFIIGLANAVILFKVLRKRRRMQSRTKANTTMEDENTEAQDDIRLSRNSLLMRVVGPVITFVNKPWKMYPVGILFGLGFDTASSIALLAVSAIANERTTNTGHVVLLPLLFTSGMTLVDTIDSILMLYSYAGFPSFGWKIIEGHSNQPSSQATPHDEPSPEFTVTAQVAPGALFRSSSQDAIVETVTAGQSVQKNIVDQEEETPAHMVTALPEKRTQSANQTRDMMSRLSIALTFMSVVVAFSISIVMIMGLIGDQCTPCKNAATADGGKGGGLAGRWWRFWGVLNDDSEWIGTGIVGSFVVVVSSWYTIRWIIIRSRAVGTVSSV